MMFVTYQVIKSGESDFKRDYEHLLTRIIQLEGNIFSYHATGRVNSLARSYNKPYDPPCIVEATFEEKHAKAYCRKAQKFFTTTPKAYQCVLQPSFPVTVLLDFGYGVRESYTYDFSEYSNDSLTAFCSKVCMRAKEVFGLYFSPYGIN